MTRISENHLSQDHKIIRSGYKSCRKEVCLGIPKRDTAQNPINFMKTALNGCSNQSLLIIPALVSTTFLFSNI